MIACSLSLSFLPKVHLRTIIPYLALMLKECFTVFFLIELRKVGYNIEQLIALWVGLQIIFSVFWGKISDMYCRRKTLNLLLGLSILSIFFLKNNYFLWAVILDGIFGNITCVARAAYCDIHIIHGRIPNIINTFIVQAIPWMLLSYNFTILHRYIFYIVFVLTIMVFILSLIFFKDFRDKNLRKKEKGFKDIITKFSKMTFFRLIVAFFLWNSLWHLILYFGEGHLKELNLHEYFFLITGIAFFTGTIIARIYKFRPERAISLVFLFTFLFFFFDWLLYLLTDFPGDVSSALFLQFTMLFGIGIPLIYSYFGEKATVHEQGTVYGFLESVGSISEFAGPFFLSFVLPLHELRFITFVPFLFVSFLLSINLTTKKEKVPGY